MKMFYFLSMFKDILDVISKKPICLFLQK
jgi:hypothetical protein